MFVFFAIKVFFISLCAVLDQTRPHQTRPHQATADSCLFFFEFNIFTIKTLLVLFAL